MKKHPKLIGLLTAAVLVGSLNPMAAKADNPIVQTIYTTDPAPMVYGDTLYVYTGHDEDGADYYDMRDWHCYSTKDMANWTDHGVVCSLNTFSWAKSDAWAGQVVERNGKFYYYVPVIAKQGGNSIGVAVSDSPTGPFKDAIGKPLCQGFGFIDPTVFVDKDGQAYLYFGNPNLHYVKLNRDMISYSGGINKVNLTSQGFGYYQGRSSSYEEGPWFYRRGNLYYMLYSAGGIPEHIAYSTSNSPTGPWTYRGIIMPTEGRSFTNHCGVVDFKGHSYFFYHNGALPGGSGFARSVAVEEFNYKPDGSFPTIKMSTSGPNPISTLNPYLKNEAETICQESGVETETCGEGTLNVGFIENNDWIKVKNVDFGNGAKSFSARVASQYEGGRIELHLDSVNGRLVGTCEVAGTGGWQKYVTRSCAVTGASGKHDLYFVFKGGNGSLMNFNYWQFTPVEGTTGNQKVETETISDGWYYLKNTLSGKYLTVQDNKAEAGTNVCISTGTGAAGQKWKVTNTSDGYITLTSGLGSFMLDIANGANEDGANIGIYHGYSGDAQKFILRKTKTNGVYNLGTKVSDGSRMVDVYEHKRTDGTNVCQWLYYGNPNQEWIFEKADKVEQEDSGQSGQENAGGNQEEEIQKPSEETQPLPQIEKKLSVDYTINSWGTAYMVSFKISNKTGARVNDWTLKLKKSDLQIDSSWNVKISEVGDYYIIKGVEWNSAIDNNAAVEFGVQGSGSIGTSIACSIQ